jgi:hypothetical protein
MFVSNSEGMFQVWNASVPTLPKWFPRSIARPHSCEYMPPPRPAREAFAFQRRLLMLFLAALECQASHRSIGVGEWVSGRVGGLGMEGGVGWGPDCCCPESALAHAGATQAFKLWPGDPWTLSVLIPLRLGATQI